MSLLPIPRGATLLAFLLFAAATPALLAQDLYVSLATTGTTGALTFQDEDVLRVNASQGLRPFLVSSAWAVLLGDANGNGLLDDLPGNIDALDVGPLGSATSFRFSAATTFVSLIGNVLDGDVFAIDASGAPYVLHTEAFFEGLTGTSAIDVDAYAEGLGGEIYFSLAEDEVTSLASLTAQNAGVATLDEQTVFVWSPGQPTASIHLTKDQVVAVFNQALGLNVTTVVDVTGVALDPQGGFGDLLLTCGSTSQTLVGRVVTTRNGGLPHLVQGQPVDPTTLGVPGASLDALAVATWSSVTLSSPQASGSSITGGASALSIEGLSPGEMVQIVVTEPIRSGPRAMGFGSAPGFGLSFLDPFHPMWLASFSVPQWTRVADASGEARYGFDFANLPIGTEAVVQCVSYTSLSVTNPIVLRVLP